MKIARVRAATRPGHDGAWRAQRFWPSEAPIEVQVLDQDEDPDPPPPRRPGEEQLQAHPTQIGRRSLAQLQGDGRLAVEVYEDADRKELLPPGTPADEAVDARMKALVGEAIDRFAERMYERLQGAIPSQAQVAEVARAAAKDVLDQALAEAVGPLRAQLQQAAAAQDALGATQKRLDDLCDRLEKQLAALPQQVPLQPAAEPPAGDTPPPPAGDGKAAARPRK